MNLRDRFSNHGRNGERAVIDIGSNTVRLVIFGGSARAPIVLHNEKVTRVRHAPKQAIDSPRSMVAVS